MRLRFAFILIVFGTCDSARGDAGEIARFEREYPPAVKRLEERFARAKGSAYLWSKTPPKNPKPGINGVTFAFDHGYEKVTRRSDLPTTGANPALHADFVYCVGENTAFSLERHPGAKQFVVVGNGSTRSDRDAYLMVFGRFAKAHCRFHGIPLARIMANPAYRLVNAERVTAQGRALVRVDYEVGAKEPKSHLSLVLDPDAGWIIRSQEFQPGNLTTNSLMRLGVTR